MSAIQRSSSQVTFFCGPTLQMRGVFSPSSRALFAEVVRLSGGCGRRSGRVNVGRGCTRKPLRGWSARKPARLPEQGMAQLCYRGPHEGPRAHSEAAEVREALPQERE